MIKVLECTRVLTCLSLSLTSVCLADDTSRVKTITRWKRISWAQIIIRSSCSRIWIRFPRLALS